KGAAVATIIARMTTFTISLLILKFKFNMISLAVLKLKYLFDTWKKVLFIGIPASITQFIIPISMGVITRMVSVHGKEAVAALGVSTRIQMFALSPMIALGTVILAFTGQNIGAKKYDRVEKGIKFSQKFSLITGVILFLLLTFTSKHIAAIFDNDPTVISIIVLYLTFVSAGFGFQGIMFITANTFNAMHKPYKAMGVNIIRMLVLYIPLAWIGSYLWGLPGIFIGAGISSVVGGIVAIFWVNRTVAFLT
ncbi:MAG: MATE family efflux transporter, partial [Candidatus Delongbacteria bacterium]|nr:MATE family efflux transporter [Candidatus Delongbacteria bacterium]